jgi:hypothetical protein
MTALPKIDRREVMRDAHKRFKQGQRLNMGWDFARCLRTAWCAAKIRQGHAAAFRHADRRRKHTRDFIFVSSAAMAA